MNSEKFNITHDGYFEATAAAILEKALERGVFPVDRQQEVLARIDSYTADAFKFGKWRQPLDYQLLSQGNSDVRIIDKSKL
ncbi:MAG: hypothetical protein LBF70_00995 [Holosporales bacterium]|jgi:hypothetical protein|nr:hypothetical protein [Holosporales bacterium]